MTRIKLALTALAAAALVAVPAGQSAATILVGTDGPGFTITLTKAGKKVTTLKAGTYVIKVSDKSNIHNFHLKGPGLNKTTSVTGTGTATWTVKLKPGTWTYVCDPHSATMVGRFKVTA
jgi:plastocyanin